MLPAGSADGASRPGAPRNPEDPAIETGDPVPQRAWFHERFVVEWEHVLAGWGRTGW